MESIKMKLINPCTETWENMKISKNGRFCSSCSKEVLDFTKMTDKEIYEFAKKNSKGAVCGKVYKTQLNHNLTPQKRSYKRFLFFLISVLTLKLFNSEANERVEKKELYAKEQKNYEKGSVDLSNSKVADDKVWKIKGKVIDEQSNKPMIGLVIKAGQESQTVTDRKGNFTIILNPEKYSQYRQIIVDVPFGYTPESYLLDKDTKKRVIIKIHQTRVEEVGGLGFSIEKSIWDKWFS